MRRILSVFIAACLVLSLFTGILVSMTSARADTSGDYQYTVASGNATITGYTGAGGAVVIPDTLDGYPVVGIGVTSTGDGAFEWCRELTSVTIPNSVTTIGHDAFYRCSSLTAAYFLGNAPTGTSNMFQSCATGFTVWYISGTAGWTNPWYGYPTPSFPIRAIIESLGGSVSWNPDEKKVTVTLRSLTLELWIGKNTAKVNGVDTPIDAANDKVVPEIINSRTMLPLRFVTENLGCDVEWDGITKTITTTYPGSSTTGTVPSATTGVTAMAGNGQVTISWDAVSGATSYNIYWSTTSGPTKTSGTKITGATSPYSHVGRTNGTPYYYVVTAVDSSGDSVELAQVLATPTADPAIITGFTPKSGTMGSQITLTGTHFNTEISGNTVRINDLIAAVTNASASELKVIVPEGAMTGKISLTIGGITTTTTDNFTVADFENTFVVRGLYVQFEKRGSASGYWSGDAIKEFNNFDPVVGHTVKEEIALQLDEMKKMGVNSITFELRSSEPTWNPGPFLPPECNLDPVLGLQYPQPTLLEIANLTAFLDLVDSKQIKVLLRLVNTHMEEQPPLNNTTWLGTILNAIKNHPALELVLFDGNTHLVDTNGDGIKDQCGIPAEPPLWLGPSSVPAKYVKWAIQYGMTLGLPAYKLSAECGVGSYNTDSESPSGPDATDLHSWRTVKVLKQIFDDLAVPDNQRTYAISFYQQRKCENANGVPCVDADPSVWAEETLKNVFEITGRKGSRVVAVEMGVSKNDPNWTTEQAFETDIKLIKRYGMAGGCFWRWAFFDDNEKNDPTLATPVKKRGLTFEYNPVKDIMAQYYLAINTYTLAYTPGPYGTISGTLSQTVDYGADGTQATAVPDIGCHFVEWSDNHNTTAARTDINVTASINATATFAVNTHTLTVNKVGNGSVTLDPAGGTYNHDTLVTLTATPATGYTFTGWSGDLSGTTNPTTITMNANKTVTALFTALPTYTLTPSAGTGGAVTPSTMQTVLQGGNATFTIVPNVGYHIADVSVDGVSQGIISSYTFTNVTSNHTISARFEEEKKQTVMVLQIGKSFFTVNGASKALDSPPVIKNSRTLVPIRAIIEALAGTVGWDATTKKATVTLGKKTIALWIGKSAATVNGVSTPIDSTNAKVVPEIINSRTMLPLRFVSENLGATVGWDQNTQTITITYTP